MQDGVPSNFDQCARPVLQQHFGDTIIFCHFVVWYLLQLLILIDSTVIWNLIYTVGYRNIRTLAKILANFLWLDCQFVSSHTSYKLDKALWSWLTNIFFLKKCIRYEFFDTNYVKCSNNFAVNCIRLLHEMYQNWKVP